MRAEATFIPMTSIDKNSRPVNFFLAKYNLRLRPRPYTSNPSFMTQVSQTGLSRLHLTGVTLTCYQIIIITNKFLIRYLYTQLVFSINSPLLNYLNAIIKFLFKFQAVCFLNVKKDFIHLKWFKIS